MILTQLSAFVFLLSLPVILILHLIRRHRTQLTVASTFLWQEVLKSYRRRFFLQTLLRNLPLLLQILAATLLVLALVDPFIPAGKHGAGDTVILVLDSSASMKTIEAGATRFERAVDEAWDFIQALGPRSRVAIVSGGAVPRISGPFTADKLVLRDHLRRLIPTEEPGNMQLVLITAAGLAPVESDYSMVLVSDGAFDLERPELLKDLPLDYIEVGSRKPNVGITAFQFRKPINGLHEYEVLVGLKNSSATPYAGILTVHAESGAISESRISLEPFASSTLVFPYDGLLARHIQAEITPGDSFEVDDIAYAVLGKRERTRVHLATPGNFFLEKLLQSYPNLTVTIANEPAGPEEYDIAIFDRVSPPLDFQGRALLIGVVDASSTVAVGPIVQNPTVTGWLSMSPLIQSVDLTAFSIYRSLSISRENLKLTSVVHSGQNSLLYTIVDGPTSLVGISFDVAESDLPLTTAFPVLISNILSWLDRDSVVGGQALTGGTYAVSAAEALEVTVISPDGSTDVVMTNSGSALLTGLETSGFYSVEYDEISRDFAVNLLNKDESDISPRFTPWDSESGEDTGGDKMDPSLRSLRQLLILAALLIVLAEWIVWVRGRR